MTPKIKENLEKAGWCSLLIFSLAMLWLVVAVFVAAHRYPIASETQVFSNAGSLYLLQRVEELEDQQKLAKTYKVTITVTKTFEREVQALDKEHLQERIERHRRKIERRNYQASHKSEITSIVEKK